MEETIKRYEKQIFDLRQLIEISRALNSTLDYHYLVQVVLDMCLAQAQSQKAGLFLTPEIDADALLLINTLDKSESYKINITSPLLRHLEEKKQGMTIFELQKLFSRSKDIQILERLGAELVIGMIAKGSLIGLIFLGEKITGDEYSSEDKSFLTDLASLSAIAVTNARLYERATTDMMTNLKNHAYFQSFLREQRKKSIKRKTPLALIFSDIDKFKNVNDIYGHQAGDIVLKAVAELLKKNTRKDDLTARYGGEEFCIVMPNTDKKTAMQVAERIRQEIEANEIIFDEKKLNVTISLGVVLLDEKTDAKNNESLIERADQALYACKKNGRNQVQFYTKKLQQSRYY